MAVINILKDGTIVKDLTGHIVKMDDVPAVYQLIDTINHKHQIAPLECKGVVIA